MTNREYVESMSTESFVDWVMIEAPRIMSRYTNKANGLAEWLDSEQTAFKEWYEIPLYDLGLSPTVYEAIYRYGVRNAGDLANVSKTVLVRMKNVGEKATEQLSNVLFNICGRTFPP